MKKASRMWSERGQDRVLLVECRDLCNLQLGGWGRTKEVFLASMRKTLDEMEEGETIPELLPGEAYAVYREGMFLAGLEGVWQWGAEKNAMETTSYEEAQRWSRQTKSHIVILHVRGG